jgi:hypothetical protein
MNLYVIFALAQVVFGFGERVVGTTWGKGNRIEQLASGDDAGASQPDSYGLASS